MKKLIVSILILVSMITSSLYASRQILKKVTLILLWAHQAQFAGYVVAADKGIYKKYGLDVTILQGGPTNPPARLLEQKKADFAVMWLAAAVQRRARGVKIVNLAQMFQKSALMFIAKKSDGIEKLEDLNNKKISLWEGDLRIKSIAFIRKYNLKTTIIPQSYSIDLFLRGGVNAISAMCYNEYHTVLNSGFNPEELTVFSFEEHGLDFPEDGLYALEETILNNPDTVKPFVKASLEGWSYAFDHPEEALDIVLKYMQQANIPASRVHQRWMLNKIRELMLCDDPKEFGVLKQEDYQQVLEELKSQNLINTIPRYEDFIVGF